LRPAQANSSWDPITKIPNKKKSQVEWLKCTCLASETLSSNPSVTKKKKKKTFLALDLNSSGVVLVNLNFFHIYCLLLVSCLVMCSECFLSQRPSDHSFDEVG
jgi:hypothetical protein